MTTAATAARYDAVRMLGVANEVSERRAEAQAILDDLARALGKLHDFSRPQLGTRDKGIRAYLDDTLAGLLDQASDIQGGFDRDLDEAGIWTPETLDMGEVQELLKLVRA